MTRLAKAAATAKVAELVDALDLGSSGATRESSNLSFRILQAIILYQGDGEDHASDT